MARHKESNMHGTKSHATTVQLSSGFHLLFDANDLNAFFEQVLHRTLEADRATACPLSGPDAVALECDREVCFVAGQLLLHATVDMDSLRNEFCCWFDGRPDGASSAALYAHG